MESFRVLNSVINEGFESTVSNNTFRSYKKSFTGVYNYTCIITDYGGSRLDFNFHTATSSGCYAIKNVTLSHIKQLIKLLF